MNNDTYLDAMKASMIPEKWSGVWFVNKINVPKALATERFKKTVILPGGEYTYLRRLTNSTIHLNQPGEVVMEDTPFELRTHLGMKCVGREPGVKRELNLWERNTTA